MGSIDDDIILAAASFIILSKKKKRKHKYWVRPSLIGRNTHGGIELINALRKDDLLAGRIEDGQIRNFLRMTDSDFEWLLNLVGPKITKNDTNFRKAITPTERLLITLRFLATGDSYTSLMHLFRISKQAISKIVPEVCIAICEVLGDQIKMPGTAEEWKVVATQFNNLWNFPQCTGVMDGKHIMIQSPEHSGSDYFNYKSFFSIVLFIVANANYEVLYMNVGCQGRISDGGVYENTQFKRMLSECKLNLPNNEKLPGRAMAVPYVFLGDDAFPLSPNLMKPYPGTQEKGSQGRIFNYRLSRARRVSENVFGILSARFRVFRKIMLLEPTKAETIVTACICLHNYLRKKKIKDHLHSTWNFRF
uniref:Protein ALP1-like n=2 Tax=Diabrotica virgifera virgifera TaxID=50390 RepID=A0A6P7FGA1_DIAVI